MTRSFLVGIAFSCALLSSAARADYPLICQAVNGSQINISVRGASGFDDACRTVATNPYYNAFHSCIDGNGQRGACPQTGGQTKPSWRLTAVIPTSPAGPSGILKNGNTYVEQFGKGVFTYTETVRGGAGTCKVVITFSDPPPVLQPGGPPNPRVVATATVTTPILPLGSYYPEGFGATYGAPTLKNRPAEGLGWDPEDNPGVANLDAILVGCEANYPKNGRTVWTVIPPDPSYPLAFEINGYVGNQQLLVTRWNYQKQ